ncbi:MAG: sigma factor-like helix-turn-helix DNA-binding protein [Phycisphaeraceae bacterium]
MADSNARQVREYVQTLGNDDRYIVMLYYADGLTPMEISRVLDLPSTRVRTRLEELRATLTGLAQPKARTTTKPAGPSVTAYA